MIGREDLIGDPRYRDAAARTEHEAEINAMIADWTKQARQARGDAHRSARAGIPAGAVLDTMELADDPTFDERGILQTMEHPTVKDYAMPAWPVRHDGAPPAVEGLAAAGRAHRRGARELARPRASATSRAWRRTR